LNHVETPSEFQGVHSFSYLHAAPKVTLDDVGVLVQFNDVAARGLNAGGQTGDDPHPVRGSHGEDESLRPVVAYRDVIIWRSI
jgi:hypothetical protein